MVKAVFCALFVLCLIVDTYCIKLSECPPGYRCHKKVNQLRFRRASDSQEQDDYLTEECPAGTFSLGEAIECTPCEVGTYADQPSSTGCYICPKGHMCPKTDKNAEPCPVGSYNNQTHQTCCRSCPPGKYSLFKGMPQCNSCPTGQRCVPKPKLACEQE